MKKRGFTLFEIMNDVSIIGLLAGIGIPAISRGVRNSDIKQAQAELEMISAAVLQLAWDTGKWPNGKDRTGGGSAEMWDISGDNCGLFGNDGTYSNWKGPYYDGAIKDPWNRHYFFDPDYYIDGDPRIAIGSYGPNGGTIHSYDSDNIYVLLDD